MDAANLSKSRLMYRLLAMLLAMSTFALSAIPAPVVRTRHFDEFSGLSHHHCTSLTVDRDGMLWIGTWMGLQRYDGYGFTTFKSHPGDGSSLSYDRFQGIHAMGSKIYCKAEEKCYIFDIRTGKFSDSGMGWNEACRRYRFNGYVTRLRTPDGSLWTIDSLGISQQYSLPEYYQRVGFSAGSQVRCLFRDRQGRIWLASRGDRTVGLFDSKLRLIGYLSPEGRVVRKPVAFGHAVYTMFQDRRWQMWLGCRNDCMYRLRETGKGNFKVEHITHDSRGNKVGLDVYDIKQDRWGRLWVSTMGLGLKCIPDPYSDSPTIESRFWEQVKPESAFKSVRNVCILPDGVMLICTTHGLVVTRLSGQNPETFRFTTHSKETDRRKSLSNSSAMYALMDSRHNIYICTEGAGVSRVSSPDLLGHALDFSHYGEMYLSSAFEYGGGVWFVGSKGLYFLDIKRDKLICYDNKTWGDNLLFSDAVPLDMGGGRWMFGLIDGAAIFDLNRLRTIKYVPKLVVTKIRIEDSVERCAVTELDTLLLNKNQRNVRISFAAVDYRNCENTCYRFRIDDGEWRELDRTRTLALLNLSPGTYKVSIESMGANGNWAGNTKVLTVVVTPKWWQTTVARISYIVLLLLVALVAVGLYNYVKGIKRKQKEALDAYLSIANSQEATREHQMKADDEEFMARVSACVNAHIAEANFSVNDLADELGVSYSQVNKRIKAIVGITPKELVTSTRMRKACRLLRTTTKTVKEIAYDCGFADQNYFGKSFKAEMGMSPTDYRRAAPIACGNGQKREA